MLELVPLSTRAYISHQKPCYEYFFCFCETREEICTFTCLLNVKETDISFFQSVYCLPHFTNYLNSDNVIFSEGAIF